MHFRRIVVQLFEFQVLHFSVCMQSGIGKGSWIWKVCRGKKQSLIAFHCRYILNSKNQLTFSLIPVYCIEIVLFCYTWVFIDIYSWAITLLVGWHIFLNFLSLWWIAMPYITQIICFPLSNSKNKCTDLAYANLLLFKALFMHNNVFVGAEKTVREIL